MKPYLIRAEQEISYFFWRATIHQLSMSDVDQGWIQLQHKIFDNCPERPPEGQRCPKFDALVTRWQPKYEQVRCAASLQCRQCQVRY